MTERSQLLTGAWQGAKLGLVGGILVGAAASAIPGLGTLFGTAVTGAGIGAALGGIGALVGSLTKMGLPRDQAEALDSDLKGEAVLLSVKEGAHSDVPVALQKGSPTRVVTA